MNAGNHFSFIHIPLNFEGLDVRQLPEDRVRMLYRLGKRLPRSQLRRLPDQERNRRRIQGLHSNREYSKRYILLVQISLLKILHYFEVIKVSECDNRTHLQFVSISYTYVTQRKWTSNPIDSRRVV